MCHAMGEARRPMVLVNYSDHPKLKLAADGGKLANDDAHWSMWHRQACKRAGQLELRRPS